MKNQDWKRLSDNTTAVIAQGLHYCANMDKINSLRTAREVSEAIDGGIDRYRKDYVYRIKVQSLVARLMDVYGQHLERMEVLHELAKDDENGNNP